MKLYFINYNLYSTKLLYLFGCRQQPGPQQIAKIRALNLFMSFHQWSSLNSHSTNFWNKSNSNIQYCYCKLIFYKECSTSGSYNTVNRILCYQVSSSSSFSSNRASTSSLHLAWCSGWIARLYSVQDRPLAVVSCPSNTNVSTSALISSLDNPTPCSS